MPVKGGAGPPLTVRKDWSCVLMYSMGHVQQHSTAPATQPAAREIDVVFFLGAAIAQNRRMGGSSKCSSTLQRR